MKNRLKSIHRIVFITGGLVVGVVLALYLGGFFRPSLNRPDNKKAAVDNLDPSETIGRAAVEHWPEWYEAVGTVRSRRETQIAAQITGRIVEIAVKPGDRVEKGMLLLQLDDREFKARVEQATQGLQTARAKVEQAKQALAGAKAAYVEASAHHERTQRFFREEAATERDLEQALAVFQQAQAGMKQAEKGMTATQAAARQAEKVVEEARVALGYTEVTAPEAGQIAKRLVEPGDLAQPGKPLVVLQMPEALRLEAHVREGLIQRVLPGSRLRVNVDAVETTLDGTVEEVIPSADPSTRTFLVKVGIPAVPGLYPGMFGRLLIPLEERKTVVVPLNAIQRIGQMTVVKIRQQGQWVHCFVRTGETLDGKIAILSGLEGNEEIAIHTGEHE